MAEPASARLTIWGSRGSLPVGGPGTARHGGATACVVVSSPGRGDLILDAGSGLRGYGLALAPEALAGPHLVLLSHAHWDHVCGLPFFAPLYEAAAHVTVMGPDQPTASIGEIARGLFAPAVWPLAPRATVEALPVAEGPLAAGGYEVRAARLAHAGVTLGYRVETGTGASVSYVTDNELGMMHPEARAALVHLVRGSDVLIHDATWADAILADRAGWGHSSVGETVALGMEAECRKVVLFHHDPDADDDALERNLAAAMPPGGGGPEVLLARDGLTLQL